MLSELYIENMAVIQKATMTFSPGLNIFTGETGAGKTILINAINAVLGARLYRDIIRTGENRAFVSAVFTDIEDDICRRIEQLGFCADDGQLIITREIDTDGKGSCRINSRPASVSSLREIAPMLIGIHGQHESQNLLSAEKHLDFIDAFARLQGSVAAYREVYDKMTETERELGTLEMDEGLKLQRLDILNYQINEIEEAGLSEGEEEELLEQRRLIHNSEKIISALSGIYELINGGDSREGMLSGLDELMQELSLASKYVESLTEFSPRLSEAAYELQELGALSRSMLDDFDFDPAQLNVIESRLDKIYRIKKKYGDSVANVLDYYEKAAAERDDLTFSEEKCAKLSRELEVLRASAQSLAAELTEKRLTAAETFTALIEEELRFLDMGGVRVKAQRTEKPLSPTGADGFELFIAANVGETPKPLSKIASGGELSRIMLAIKNVLAEKDLLATMIFDEVDSGVSGSAAQKIGAKLAQAAVNRQVICVTHLAQVAAFADTHVKIYKTVENDRTFTRLEKLDTRGRIEELARIMVGASPSEIALQNAAELLENSAGSLCEQ